MVMDADLRISSMFLRDEKLLDQNADLDCVGTQGERRTLLSQFLC